MGKPRERARPKGLEGHLLELSTFDRALPHPDDAADVIAWVTRLDRDIEFSYGELRMSKRQRTASAFLLSHALAASNDASLARSAPQLFEHLPSLAGSRPGFAEQLLTRMAAVDGLETRALDRLGQLQQEHERWAEALNAYRRAWQLAPDPSPLELGLRLAWCEIKCGHPDVATGVLERLVERHPDEPRTAELLRIARAPSTRV